MFQEKIINNEKLELNLPNDIQVYIKREDCLHDEISGNKFRKLKYNFIHAKEKGYSKVLTFGGAYSNHIAATAAAGRLFGLQTIGVIRGHELVDSFMENPTLKKAYLDGMQLHFVTREQYRERHESEYLSVLQSQYPECFIIPEGGTNQLAILGCQEILQPLDSCFDLICCAVGTGGTLAGLIQSAKSHQKILGFPALKGDFLYNDICEFVGEGKNWELNLEYHFGGYGKINRVLMDFVESFKANTGILLDPVYTCKMMYGILDMAKRGSIPKGTKVLAIHTGGLQGWNQSIKIKK